ncbi:MAG: aldose 1-epimerase family protein [Microcella sp.]|uniref:aldose 1-epimerase family protein n=1 Tax=Microcella sp. TaxID=1913979 RepID=UPI003315662E
MNRIELFGVPLHEALRRMGGLHQAARIDRLVDDDGAGRGSRRFRMITGGGLEVEIHPDRALDLGNVTYRGAPVAWMSPTGVTAPGLGDPRGSHWLRTFGGGLLATCGLDTFGAPGTANGVEYPLHGRVGLIPGTIHCSGVQEGEVVLEGSVRQAAVLGENILLSRRWSATIGGSTLRLQDTVRNEGREPVGHMIMYHVNIGWPLLDESSTLTLDSSTVSARDEASRAGHDAWSTIEPPQAGYREKVFGHEFDGGGIVTVSLDNPVLDMRFDLSFDSSTLPALHQWKMSGEGHYVLGLEPVNVNTFGGRPSADRLRMTPQLEPGEQVSYRLEFALGPSSSRESGALRLK